MATRRDPSATGLLARSFASAIRHRFAQVARDIYEAVYGVDVFGLDNKPAFSIFNVEKKAWRFKTDAQKVTAFKKWLLEQIDLKVLPSDAKGDPWLLNFITSAYKKGASSAYSEANAIKRLKDLNRFIGSMQEFMQANFGGQAAIDKARLLATRALEELRGLSNEAATKLNRILSAGLIAKQSARKIAQAMVKEVKDLLAARALRIARNELVHANAEGQLDSFEAQGIETVGLYAEWHTAGDDKVCASCGALEGVQFTIKEARGMIPRHPNCRCAWLPGEVAARLHRRRTLLRRLEDSILAERKQPKGRKSKADRVKASIQSSTWWGKRLLKGKR